MAPVGHFVRSNGEYAIVHQCLGCGVRRNNRIAADDNFDLVLMLPDLTLQPIEELTTDAYDIGA